VQEPMETVGDEVAVGEVIVTSTGHLAPPNALRLSGRLSIRLTRGGLPFLVEDKESRFDRASCSC
jgi:hypothetical protein